jgi:hypothetical protein
MHEVSKRHPVCQCQVRLSFDSVSETVHQPCRGAGDGSWEVEGEGEIDNIELAELDLFSRNCALEKQVQPLVHESVGGSADSESRYYEPAVITDN